MNAPDTGADGGAARGSWGMMPGMVVELAADELDEGTSPDGRLHLKREWGAGPVQAPRP